MRYNEGQRGTQFGALTKIDAETRIILSTCSVEVSVLAYVHSMHGSTRTKQNVGKIQNYGILLFKDEPL